MKKTFKVENIDCAICAGKIEDGIKKIKGVNSASLSFMTGRLVIEAADDMIDDIVKEVRKICAKVEPDCVVTEK